MKRMLVVVVMGVVVVMVGANGERRIVPGVLANVGTSHGNGGDGEIGGAGRVVGLIGGIAAAEVLAHLLKGESALGDIGRAQTAAGVALHETLGEEKFCDALSPDLDVLLGLQAQGEVRGRGRGRGRGSAGVLVATQDGGR